MTITLLPVELINEICKPLKRQEWIALRSTCRTLYMNSLESFADRHFKSVRFLLTSDGFHKLEELAANDIIRVRVRELWMVPTVFEGHHNMELSSSESMQPDGDGSNEPSDLSTFECSNYARSWEDGQPLEEDEMRSRHATYQAIVEDHCSLLKSETFSTRLGACLARFKNLESIGLEHYTTSYLLDRRYNHVRCLGLRNLRAQMDSPFYSIHIVGLQGAEIIPVNSLALCKLLEALGNSNRKIKRLHTCGPDYCAGISPELSLSQEQYDLLSRAVEELEYLHLCINFPNEEKLEIRSTPASKTTLDLLLMIAPSLKTLVFSQWHKDERRLDPSYFSELSDSIKFTRLEELNLHWIEVRPESFMSFLSTAKATLHTLTLDWVALRFTLPWSMQKIEGLWRRVWDHLRDELSLQRLTMERLGYGSNPVVILGPRTLSGLTTLYPEIRRQLETSYEEALRAKAQVAMGRRKIRALIHV
ncbi:uncharacterized protein N7496_000201 [Penicillium cataractarum]|uniref:F-box domain-containing protein n=1 Tax=Penicillium cataractarum TaxID=2100454 RepID=A0A9X0B5Q3_9EURO|nr:uncharacterized protein N7496_000201 [Penicillium cataractarum]KAJ5389133.1 hypothetical protein N7496_000201 [Penicillium cataractarum]